MFFSDNVIYKEERYWLFFEYIVYFCSFDGNIVFFFSFYRFFWYGSSYVIWYDDYNSYNFVILNNKSNFILNKKCIRKLWGFLRFKGLSMDSRVLGRSEG